MDKKFGNKAENPKDYAWRLAKYEMEHFNQTANKSEMDKITEIRNKIASEKFKGDNPITLDLKQGFFYGFDAAMELQLPVLFADYLHRNYARWSEDKYAIQQYLPNGGHIFLTVKDIYAYWIENIYQNK